MFGTFLNKSTGFQQYLHVLTLVLFVLLSSCPVKASIKSFATDPIKTEQSSSRQSVTLWSSLDRCADSELTGKSVQAGASQLQDILPAVLFTTIAFFFFGIPNRREKVHPLYGNLKITGTLPIFLKYRKLII